jgi:hypothetical protein
VPSGGSQGLEPEGDQRVGEVPEALAKIGVSSSDWARMKGTVQSDVSGGTDGETPAEYREMANRYFREIAREGTR